jgi:hypothetical protein
MADEKPMRKKGEQPPGEFVSDDLRTETGRFLDELKERLARERAEEPKLGPPKRQSPRPRD